MTYKEAYYYCLNTGEVSKIHGIVYSNKLFFDCLCDVCKKEIDQ